MSPLLNSNSAPDIVATIGVGSHFAGNILANTSITLVSGAVLDGRALAGAVSATGAVTMDDNTVVRPAS